MGLRAIAILRKRRRCGQWRPVGVFSHHKRPGLKMSNGKVCHKCIRAGQPNPNRTGWVVTESGRAYLRGLREAAA